MTKERITQLLTRWQAGDSEALEEAVPFLHAELKRLAAYFMTKERAGHTLQSTALVNEAYMRLVDVDLEFENRTHFIALAAKIMRRILVDHAREKGRQKRGDGIKPISLDESIVLSESGDPRLVDLDEALNKLETFDARLARTVEFVFFGGMTTQEAADALGVSRVTLNKDMNLAKAWLHNEIT
ncbi:MAG TPA: sigma-70 family RNA polymerase sigma factor [Woeseiaceae bacterium]|nr:sigma-70 family RNA polymerase sigma factor [Woeseiaceae bacterium]